MFSGVVAEGAEVSITCAVKAFPRADKIVLFVDGKDYETKQGSGNGFDGIKFDAFQVY